MALLAKPAHHPPEALVVRMVPETPAPDTPSLGPDEIHDCDASAPHWDWVEFFESRRTGNIGLVIHRKGGRGSVPSCGRSSVAPSGPQQTPSAAMPAATGAFVRELRTFRAHAPVAWQSPLMEELIVGPAASGAVVLASGARGAAMRRDCLDGGLSRVVDAWPALPPNVHDSILAMLESAGQPQQEGSGTSVPTAQQAAREPPTRRTIPRAKSPNRRNRAGRPNSCSGL